MDASHTRGVRAPAVRAEPPRLGRPSRPVGQGRRRRPLVMVASCPRCGANHARELEELEAEEHLRGTS